MYRIGFGALLLLAACAPASPPSATGYRSNGRPIASAALFDAGRFQGIWHVAAAYGAEGTCGALAEDWQGDGAGGFVVRGTRCTGAGQQGFASRAVISGPGRIQRASAGGREEIWVMWVDADYRIAAIGTPDGRFGRILSRSLPPRGDLLKAATGIMEFNGYDLKGLRLLQNPG